MACVASEDGPAVRQTAFTRQNEPPTQEQRRFQVTGCNCSNQGPCNWSQPTRQLVPSRITHVDDSDPGTPQAFLIARVADMWSLKITTEVESASQRLYRNRYHREMTVDSTSSNDNRTWPSLWLLAECHRQTLVFN